MPNKSGIKKPIKVCRVGIYNLRTGFKWLRVLTIYISQVLIKSYYSFKNHFIVSVTFPHTGYFYKLPVWCSS